MGGAELFFGVKFDGKILKTNSLKRTTRIDVAGSGGAEKS